MHIDKVSSSSFSTLIWSRAGPTAGGTLVTVSGPGYRNLGGVMCKFGNAAAVKGQMVPPPPQRRPEPGADGDLRLANGRTVRQGRVEIYHDGVWGTVCDDLWDLEAARVVCQQPGFPGALNATIAAFFGPGTGQIWLDNVNCHSSAERLDRCTSHGWGVHNCDHNEDAGVVCAPSGTTPSPPPSRPTEPLLPWSRLDDFQLMRSPDGAHIARGEYAATQALGTFNASQAVRSFTCRSPSLNAALGVGVRARGLTTNIGLVVSINGDVYGTGVGQNYTYYEV